MDSRAARLRPHRPDAPFWRGLLTLGLAAAVVGCASAPRERPVAMGDVNTGTGSLESTRRQLEGSWELQTFELVPSPGQKVAQKASAVLTYDAYGNMEIVGRLEEPNQSPGAGAPLLSYKGRVVIDVARQQLRVVGATGDESRLPAEASTDLVRRYAVSGDVLTLEMVDAGGQVKASTTWKKRTR